jgi:Methyltransferase domain
MTNTTANNTVRHPIFARVYEQVARTAERRGDAEHRRKLLADLNGRVIEVGAGSGASFAHYPSTVSEVIAVEPERYLRERAQRAAMQAPVAVSVVDGVGDLLPGDDGSFDGVLRRSCSARCPTSRTRSRSCSRSSVPVASCASTSTSSPTRLVRPDSNASPTLHSGRTSRAAATWRATRQPGSKNPAL